MEFIRTLNDEGIETRRPIEIVNWTDEEGTRFPGGSGGSSIWAGEAPLTDAYATTGRDGVRFETALEKIGYKGDISVEPQEEYEAYLELHIEQGPKLAAAKAEVGIVTGVVSRSWGEVSFEGESDHSGTTPMHHRHDAMVAAADLVLAIKRIVGSVGEKTVGTAGSVSVTPDSVNVVPGQTTVTWDLRDPSDEIVDEARNRVLSEAAAAAEREGLEWSHRDRTRSYRTDFDEQCVTAVQTAADELRYDSEQLSSAAGHDAPHLSEITDVGMIFAVSENGKSHTPDEFTTWEHCYTAANTMATAAFELANKPVQ